MRINRFLATGVHGYLKFNIDFNKDITYLTGINGSGKTTVVNAISALVSPSLSRLANTKYETIQVDIEHDNQIVTLSSQKEDDRLIVRCSQDKDPLSVPILRTEDPIPSNRIVEREREYYREQEARFASHPVLKRLKSLPTPMFLGLERRSNFFFAAEENMYITHAVQRRSHNVFSTSLTRSLLEAAALAERSYNLIQSKQRQLTDSLKRQFILSALKYERAAFNEQSAPPNLDLNNIARVKTTLKEIGLSDEEIDKYLDPFVEKLRQLLAYLPYEEKLDVVWSGTDRAKASAYLEWFTNKPQYDRLIELVANVNSYIGDSQKENKLMNAYLETANIFLKDSMKTLAVDASGSLIIMMQDGKPRDITALSSGESQLVVILTQLAFNPAAQGANVFIIDEPELSLHLRWQELFVSAIRSLNSTLQIILATHSPAIILDNLDQCIDLSEARMP
ncbi:MAG: hypothetical protein JWN86_2601 [Planctomycetota bacterium]|nr:hypothetical protein [Planctomycetota bacterium]